MENYDLVVIGSGAGLSVLNYGLQKLLDAALIVNPEEIFKILESADEGAQELAKKIKSIL